MSKTRVLISVKTYPNLSKEYNELVCTAGFREDGSWVRIYPIPFRLLGSEQQYKKWQWISVDLTRNDKRDKRPESFRPNIMEPIEPLEILDISKNKELGWKSRSSFALKKVYYSMQDIIDECKETDMSLATLKPKEVVDFFWKEEEQREWDSQKLAKVMANLRQGNFFDDNDARQFIHVVRKLPYKFYYSFITEDGKQRNLMIEDWEVGALYWKMYDSYGSEDIACKKVREKFLIDIRKDRDFYFFVGTTFEHHMKNAPDPFVIIGYFNPPVERNKQLSLFD